VERFLIDALQTVKGEIVNERRAASGMVPSPGPPAGP
jgi:hypothetical protein